jgi:hypothetical protein
MYGLLKGAQAVVFRYHAEAECYWHAYADALDVSRIHIIPNGFEGTVEHFAVPKGDRCTILHAGTLTSYRYDTLLQALKLLKEHDALRAEKVRLIFVGEVGELACDAAAMGVADFLTISGPTSYNTINRLQSDAHVLLILGRPPTMEGYELFAGAKLFGYLKTGRPILGVLPDDETRKILQSVSVSTVADAESPLNILALLQQLIDAWSKGTLRSLVPDPIKCEAYCASRQTAALVAALEGATAADSFVPNRVEIPSSLRRKLSEMKEGRLHGESRLRAFGFVNRYAKHVADE